MKGALTAFLAALGKIARFVWNNSPVLSIFIHWLIVSEYIDRSLLYTFKRGLWCRALVYQCAIRHICKNHWALFPTVPSIVRSTKCLEGGCSNYDVILNMQLDYNEYAANMFAGSECWCSSKRILQSALFWIFPGICIFWKYCRPWPFQKWWRWQVALLLRTQCWSRGCLTYSRNCIW